MVCGLKHGMEEKCTGQSLKDDRRKRIISFDQTIFYDFDGIHS